MINSGIIPEPNLTLEAVLAQRGALTPDEALRVLQQLMRQVAAMHEAGRIHRAVTPAFVHLDGSLNATLAPPPASVTFGGSGDVVAYCPPPLRGPAVLELPIDLAAAVKVLAQRGVELDPRQVDIYQCGALLCWMLVGQSASAYLKSPRAKALVPASMRAVLDRALGCATDKPFDDCAAMVEAIAALDEGFSDTVATTEPDSGTIYGKTTPRSIITQADDAEPPEPPEPAQPVDAEPSKPAPRAKAQGALPFEKLGPYRLIERIGMGGMGDVYKAHDDSLDRTVAIKMLPPELGRDAATVVRFRAEATAMAKLVHPNVVQIFFVGEEQGHHFFAMQYVQGQSLAQALARAKRLKVDEAVAIAEQCLLGLGAAHEMGLTHRDVKPGNILLDKNQKHALVADFGLVKGAAAQSQMTVTGVIMGTVDYIAPEQARSQPVDHRADIYAMGVLMYQMLSGRLPFESDSATGMMFQHAYETPPPLSGVAPHVPQPLAQVIARMMAKDPADRYGSTAEVLAHLRAARRGGAAAASASASNAHAPSADDEMPSLPSLPADLLESQKSTWQHRLRQRVRDLFQEHAPEAVKRLQNTQQQVDGAVAEYQRRQRELSRLLADAQSVAADLSEQAQALRATAEAAARRAESTQCAAHRHAALAEKQQCEADAAELESEAAQQAVHVTEIENRLTRVNATQAQLSNQRDVLNARLKAAAAQMHLAGSKASPRRRAWVAGGAVAAVVLVAALSLMFRSHPEPATSGSASSIPPSAKVFAGHSYKTYFGQWTWDEANSMARGMGGHLIVVDNEAELNFLDNEMIPHGGAYYWLGLDSDRVTHRAVNGQPVDFVHFQTDQPAAQMSKVYTRGGWWGVAKTPNERFSFVTEWDKLPAGGTTTPVPPATTTSTAPPPTADQAGAPEAAGVLQRLMAEQPQLFFDATQTVPLHYFDAATAPMHNNGGQPQTRNGSFAPQVLLGADSGDNPMVSGPFDTLGPGHYLIVYRFAMLDEVSGSNVSFLDVVNGGVTVTGRRTNADETPQGQWVELAVRLLVSQPSKLEYRFWSYGKQAAVDRIYVFRQTNDVAIALGVDAVAKSMTPEQLATLMAPKIDEMITANIDKQPATLTVARMHAVPLDTTGWPQAPPALQHSAVFKWVGNRPATGTGNGAADVSVQRGGLVLMVVSRAYQGNSSGGWTAERLSSDANWRSAPPRYTNPPG